MLVSFLARGNSKTSLLKFRDSRRGIKILAFPSPKAKAPKCLVVEEAFDVGKNQCFCLI